MSYEKQLCDNVSQELLATVPGLATARVHLYTPYSVERLSSDGSAHFAVWIAPEEQGGGVVVEPFTTFSSMARYPLLISYWEPSEEADFAQADEVGVGPLFDLMERCRARFLDESFRATAPAWKMDWLLGMTGAGGTQDGGMVRYWVAEVAAWVLLQHTS